MCAILTRTATYAIILLTFLLLLLLSFTGFLVTRVRYDWREFWTTFHLNNKLLEL